MEYAVTAYVDGNDLILSQLTLTITPSHNCTGFLKVLNNPNYCSEHESVVCRKAIISDKPPNEGIQGRSMIGFPDETLLLAWNSSILHPPSVQKPETPTTD